MSEDLSVQSQQPSKVPYVLTGAAAGGAIGAAGKYYTTKPQYASYEDILKESHDDFTAKANAAKDDAKGVWDKAKEARAAADDAAKKWETDLAAYQEANKGSKGTAHLGDKEQILEDIEVAKRNLEAKKQDFIDNKVAELRKNNVSELTDKEKETVKTLDNKINEIKKAKEAYINEQNKVLANANKTLAKRRTKFEYTEFGKKYDSIGNEFEQLMQRKNSFDKTINSIKSHLKDENFKKGSVIEVMEGDKLVKKDIANIPAKERRQAIVNAKKYFNQTFNQDLKAMFPNATDSTLNQILKEGPEIIDNIVVNKESIARKNQVLNEIIKKYLEAKKNLPTEQQVLENLRSISKTNKDNTALKNLLKENTAVNNEIKTLEDTLAKAADNEKDLITKDLNKAKGKLAKNMKDLSAINDMILRDETPLNNLKTNIEKKNLLKNIKKYEVLSNNRPNSMTYNQINEYNEVKTTVEKLKSTIGESEYKKLLDEAKNATDIDNVIKNLESDLKTGEAKLKTYKESSNIVKTFDRNITKIAGEGATFDTTTKKILTADGKNFVPTASTNFVTELVKNTTDDNKILSLDRSIASLEKNKPVAKKALTEAEILEKAKASLTDDLFKGEKAAIADLKETIANWTSKLPQEPVKTAEELTEEFVKKNGTKEDAIKKVSATFKDDLKKLYTKNISNNQLAAYAAGGAAIIGALAYLMAPSKKD